MLRTFNPVELGSIPRRPTKITLVAQSEARRSTKPKVAGSNPAEGTNEVSVASLIGLQLTIKIGSVLLVRGDWVVRDSGPLEGQARNLTAKRAVHLLYPCSSAVEQRAYTP